MSALEPGQLFAKDFQVERKLSQGGMGAVYVARQLSTDKLRALKLMHPQLAPDARSRQRFIDEARIGGRIDSEHVVEVVAAGIDEASGAPWLAMELLEGEDLGSLSHQRGALPPGEVRDVFAQAGHALGLAHDKGIVHRDLKPENLFLARARREGAASVVKVLDFGIAMALPSGGAGVVTTTVGSPFWMAPEQAKPGATLTPATDVWALGLIAFQLLSGGSYWRTAKQDDASIGAVLTEILVEPMEPASVRAAALGLRALPDGFDAWFAQCVNRDAPSRFADARACLSALDALLARVGPRVAVTSARSAKETAASGVGLEATFQRVTPVPPVSESPRALATPHAVVPAQAAPGGAAPGGAAPGGAAPGGAAPGGVAPSGAAPSGAAPSGVAVSVDPSRLGTPGAHPSAQSPLSETSPSAANAPPRAAPPVPAPSASTEQPPKESRASRLIALAVAIALLIAWRGLNHLLDSAEKPVPPPPAPPSFVVAPNLQPPQPIVAPPPVVPPSPVVDEVIDAGTSIAAVVDAGVRAPIVHHPRPPPAPTGPLVAERVKGEKCPGPHVTPAEARANATQLCAQLDQWEIVRLANGGSMDGPGYQCKVRDHDTRELGASLCRR